MPAQVVNLARERRRRTGRRPALAVLGDVSRADNLIVKALAAVDPDERLELFARLTAGTYGQLLVCLSQTFELEEIDLGRVAV